MKSTLMKYLIHSSSLEKPFLKLYAITVHRVQILGPCSSMHLLHTVQESFWNNIHDNIFKSIIIINEHKV
jgi:hypothetical protein